MVSCCHHFNKEATDAWFQSTVVEFHLHHIAPFLSRSLIIISGSWLADLHSSMCLPRFWIQSMFTPVQNAFTEVSTIDHSAALLTQKRGVSGLCEMISLCAVYMEKTRESSCLHCILDFFRYACYALDINGVNDIIKPHQSSGDHANNLKAIHVP